MKGTGLVLLLALAACAAERPMTRAGATLDRTGSRVGDAVGRAAESTGSAVQRAGGWMRERTASDMRPRAGLEPE
jgi:hypothetical protein